MDLKKYDTKERAEKGAIMPVLSPETQRPLFDDTTGEQVQITLLGADSSRFRKGQFELAREQLRTTRRRTNSTADDMEAALKTLIGVLAECTLDWKHIAWNGEVLECNKPNATMLYTELPWLREQVSEFVQDRANYLGN